MGEAEARLDSVATGAWALTVAPGTRIKRFTAPTDQIGQLTADGVIVAPVRRVPDLLQALPAIVAPERVAWLADRARLRFHAAA
jgi:hypothetical protein